MLKRRSPIWATTAVVLALGLAGCGGGGGGSDDDNDNAGNDNGQTADTFVARVMQVIGVATEDAEPVAIDAETATQPENTEPIPVS